MIRKIPVLALPVALVVSLIACTLSQPATTISPVDAAATIVAMTLQAQGIKTAPAPGTTAAPSAEPATATPTTKPSITVGTNGAQCRSGPGANFDLIASYASGTTADLIAKDTADGYWLVKDPGTGNSCWLGMQEAAATGSHELLPEVTPQANTAQDVPAKPGSSAAFDYWEYACGAGSVTVNLRWIDAADDETGYRIYRLGELIAELAAGSTSYTDSLSGGGSLSYSIRAYNAAGESAPLNTPSFSC
jgi:hypothetical protein